MLSVPFARASIALGVPLTRQTKHGIPVRSDGAFRLPLEHRNDVGIDDVRTTLAFNISLANNQNVLIHCYIRTF